MKSLSFGLIALAAAGLATGTQAAISKSPADTRPRLIVLTDIGNEPDDSESMVRLMTYSNDIEIDGLVAATSHHLPHGTHKELIEQRVDAYAQSLSNLRVHDPRYPDAAKLKSVIRSGSQVYGMLGVGKGKLTEGSRLIIAEVDKADTRPVHIAVWGGAADLAEALWTVRATRTPAELKHFVSKLRVYSISDQDDSGAWARGSFPDLVWVTSAHGFLQYQLGTWLGISSPQPGADAVPVSKAWLKDNIQSKGPLGHLYPTYAYIMEGDTPSYLSVIPNGLNNPDRPDWGGWGGRYMKLSDWVGLYGQTTDNVRGTDGKFYNTPQATIWRWRQDFQNDFAARMAWSVTPAYNDANHAPKAVLNAQAGQGPVDIKACPGEPVTLSATGSSDPDGNTLTYHWLFYREAGGIFSPDLKFSVEDGETVTATVGAKANVDQFDPPATYQLHVILQVTDNGAPALTAYRRAIITVLGASSPTATVSCAVLPVPPHHQMP